MLTSLNGQSHKKITSVRTQNQTILLVVINIFGINYSPSLSFSLTRESEMTSDFRYSVLRSSPIGPFERISNNAHRAKSSNGANSRGCVNEPVWSSANYLVLLNRLVLGKSHPVLGLSHFTKFWTGNLLLFWEEQKRVDLRFRDLCHGKGHEKTRTLFFGKSKKCQIIIFTVPLL